MEWSVHSLNVNMCFWGMACKLMFKIFIFYALPQSTSKKKVLRIENFLLGSWQLFVPSGILGFNLLSQPYRVSRGGQGALGRLPTLLEFHSFYLPTCSSVPQAYNWHLREEEKPELKAWLCTSKI